MAMTQEERLERRRAAGHKWREANREKDREKSRIYQAANPEAARERTRKWHAEKPEKSMLGKARDRALQKGVPFSITESDIVIPVACPVLGIELIRGTGNRGLCDTSPSLDRIVPALGYVPGNVAVISWLANRLKSNATPDQLKAVWEYAARVTPPNVTWH